MHVSRTESRHHSAPHVDGLQTRGEAGSYKGKPKNTKGTKATKKTHEFSTEEVFFADLSDLRSLYSDFFTPSNKAYFFTLGSAPNKRKRPRSSACSKSQALRGWGLRRLMSVAP
jgi:hypothetical protein